MDSGPRGIREPSRILHATDVGWPINGGVDNIRYSPLTQINRDNVAPLQVAWTYDSHDAFKGRRCRAIRSSSTACSMRRRRR